MPTHNVTGELQVLEGKFENAKAKRDEEEKRALETPKQSKTSAKETAQFLFGALSVHLVGLN